MFDIKKIKKPILITGSSGFIGSNLLRYFVKNKIKVNIILRKESNLWRIKDLLSKTNVFIVDLRDKKKLAKIIKTIKPKTIFHLATYGAYSHQDNINEIQSGILESTINLVQECQKYKFDIFINTGSNSEYGFSSKKMNENDQLKPNSYYSIFKAASTNFCEFQSITKKISIVTVRPFHVFGPYEDPNRLIPTLISNMLYKQKIKLVSPKIARDCIYIDDVIDLYLIIASHKNNFGEIYNIGSGKQKTIKEIFDKISNSLNYNKKVKWNTMKNRMWDQSFWVADMDKVKNKFNWKPKNTLNKGINKTIRWYKEFYKFK